MWSSPRSPTILLSSAPFRFPPSSFKGRAPGLGVFGSVLVVVETPPPADRLGFYQPPLPFRRRGAFRTRDFRGNAKFYPIRLDPVVVVCAPLANDGLSRKSAAESSGRGLARVPFCSACLQSCHVERFSRLYRENSCKTSFVAIRQQRLVEAVSRFNVQNF